MFPRRKTVRCEHNTCRHDDASMNKQTEDRQRRDTRSIDRPIEDCLTEPETQECENDRHNTNHQSTLPEVKDCTPSSDGGDLQTTYKQTVDETGRAVSPVVTFDLLLETLDNVHPVSDHRPCPFGCVTPASEDHMDDALSAHFQLLRVEDTAFAAHPADCACPEWEEHARKMLLLEGQMDRRRQRALRDKSRDEIVIQNMKNQIADLEDQVMMAHCAVLDVQEG